VIDITALRAGAVSVSVRGLGRFPLKLLAWICAFGKVVRQHDGYIYVHNAITDQRGCRWDSSACGRDDYNFMRSGDVSYGPLGRRVFD
jgi:hypothetical protein